MGEAAWACASTLMRNVHRRAREARLLVVAHLYYLGAIKQLDEGYAT